MAEMIEQPSVMLVAYYHWICPACGGTNEEWKVETTVHCVHCHAEHEVAHTPGS